MKKLPIALTLWALAVAGPARALSTDDPLVAVTAMPLAVAEVAALPEVPRQDLVDVVTILNRALVPAPQFVEIVRYVPVALVEPAEPRFVTYVSNEYSNGLRGEPLALAIEDRYEYYGYEEVEIEEPPVVTYVESRQILPATVVTRFQPVEFDPLALIAMPLAVAAVSEIADIPAMDLMRLVTSLNQARVPAPQFVEVVRYSPVVLVDRSVAPQFLEYVTTEVDRGIWGRPLAFSLVERIERVEPLEIDIWAPRPPVVVAGGDLLPPVVRSRSHPHGGPPGQLKKELGLQTGAEVVHGASRGARPSRVADADRRVERREKAPRARAERSDKPSRARAERAEPRREKTKIRKSDGRAATARADRPRKVREAKPAKVKRNDQVQITAPPRGGNAGGPPHKAGGGNGGGKGGGKGQGKGKG